jgi:uncharacterized protein (TIGR00730 family)
MGIVADAVLAGGGRVTGVITESLADHEIAHGGLTRLEVVRTMHERKARMADLSDAVIMLPGGFGTLEEFMEAVTWVHLGIHDKPCGVLNVDGFFDHLLRFLTSAVDAGFIPGPLVNGLIVSDDPVTLLDALAQAAGSSTPARRGHPVARIGLRGGRVTSDRVQDGSTRPICAMNPSNLGI